MKIVYATSNYLPHTGGMENHCHFLCKELVKRGHDVTIVTSWNPINSPDYSDMCKIVRVPTTGKLLWGFGERGQFMGAPLMFTYMRELRKVLLTEKPDILQSNNPHWLSEQANVAARGTKIPHLVMFHAIVESCPELVTPEWGHKAFIKSYLYTIQAATLKRCTRIVTLTRNYANNFKFLSRFSSKMDFVPDGINISDFDSPKYISKWKEFGDPLISFVGRFVPYKGIPFLIKAAVDVKEIYPSGKIIIVGDGPLSPRLRAYAKHYGVSDYIKFVGKLTHDNLVSLLYASDLFVLPSVNNMEAFGIVLLEAAWCKTPVITTDLWGPSEVAKSLGGLVVPKRNHKELSKTIISLLGDKQRRERIVKQGRETILKKYTWEKVADKFEATYDTIV